MTQAQMRQNLDSVIEHYYQNPASSTENAASIINDALPLFPDFLVAPDALGYSIFHKAASCNALEIISLLSHQYGVDANIATNINNFTPLHFAAAYGNIDSSLGLIAISPDTLNAVDMNGCPPLYLSVVNGHIDLALTLIEHGSDVGMVQDLLISFLIDPSLCAMIHPLSFGLVEMDPHEVRIDKLVTPLIQAIDPETNMPIFDVNYKNQDGCSILDAAMHLNAYVPLHAIEKIRQAAQESSFRSLTPQPHVSLEHVEPHEYGAPDAKRYKPNNEMVVAEMEEEEEDGLLAPHAAPSVRFSLDSMSVSSTDERDIAGDLWEG